MIRINNKIQGVLIEAIQARDRAYSPYSKLKVGAAFLVHVDGREEIIRGCNVENSSYGATLCAERVAIGQMVANFGQLSPEFLVLTSTSPHGPIPPCGLCLQVLKEFVSPDFKIYLADSKEILIENQFSDFLPTPFQKEMLPS